MHNAVERTVVKAFVCPNICGELGNLIDTLCF